MGAFDDLLPRLALVNGGVPQFCRSVVMEAAGGLFRFALIYPAIYPFPFIMIFCSPKPALMTRTFLFQLVAVTCMFYNLYFVSKNLVVAETGKPASFHDYAGPFFLIWFFPIGIWFIQPGSTEYMQREGALNR